MHDHEREELTEQVRQFRDVTSRRLDRLTKWMEIMTNVVKELLDKIASVDTKIDAYAVIVAAQADVITDLRTQLASFADEPKPEDVRAAIDSLDAHIATLDAAVTKVQASDPQQAPAPAPAPEAAPGTTPQA